MKGKRSNNEEVLGENEKKYEVNKYTAPLYSRVKKNKETG